MKKRQRTTTKVDLILLIFAVLAIAFLPLRVWAADATDTDGDGIPDEYEGSLTVLEQTDTASISMDDLFIILKGYDLDLVPEDRFDFIVSKYSSTSIPTPVNPMEVHVITTNTDQTINQKIFNQGNETGQNALLVIANPDPNDGDLGASQIGYPAYSTGIQGNVFIQRIKDDVVKGCSLQPNCNAVNSAGEIVATDIAGIVDYYIKNVFAHETFHMLGRVVPADRKYDYHYPQLGYIMDHHMYYKEYSKTGFVTWFISNKWNVGDIPRFK